MAEAAESAFEESQLVPLSERINSLRAIRLQLEKGKTEILAANVEDLKLKLQGVSPVFTLATHEFIDDGLELFRVSCPIGALLVIFEARPEVVVNIVVHALSF